MEGARLFTTPVWPGTPYTAACTRVLGTPRALGLKIPFSLFMPPWKMESSLPVLNRKPYTAGLRDSLRLNSGSKGTGALVHAFLVLKPLELPGNTGEEGSSPGGPSLTRRTSPLGTRGREDSTLLLPQEEATTYHQRSDEAADSETLRALPQEERSHGAWEESET